MNVCQTKIDRTDLSGFAHGDNEEEIDEGMVPNFPCLILQFELCDGVVRLNANQKFLYSIALCDRI